MAAPSSSSYTLPACRGQTADRGSGWQAWIEGCFLLYGAGPEVSGPSPASLSSFWTGDFQLDAEWDKGREGRIQAENTGSFLMGMLEEHSLPLAYDTHAGHRTLQ